jgi:hypothetical protein
MDPAAVDEALTTDMAAVREAVDEDLAMDPEAVGEVVGEDLAVDPTTVSEALVVDPAAVDEDPTMDPKAVSEATVVQAWRRSRSGCASGGEMIVARVRVYGRVAAHLKRRIVATSGIDYVSTPVTKAEY